MLRSSGAVAVMVSEEDEAAVLVAEAPDAKYVVVFDPLDGSSNIDCNVSVGSIFGVYRRRQDPLAPARFAAAASAADALRPGDELVAAGYANYGSATQLCLALAEDAPDAAAGREAKGVNVFSLDTEVGEFIMSHACLRIPATPKRIYSINAGGLASMPRAVRRFVAECNGEAREGAGAGGGSPAGASAAAAGTGAGAGAYSLRYVGSMVADVRVERARSRACALTRAVASAVACVRARARACSLTLSPAPPRSCPRQVHRTLVYGGVFLYPATKASPSGKLRLLYEAAPMALITECAGGKAITGATGAGSGGSRRLLEVVPAALHERVPVALGCSRDVTRLEELLAAEE